MLKAILLATLLVSTVYGAQYAVLVAGSNGWSNYRHQSDICHSYQILVGNGVPAANIIVMAYNDIADNKKNPFPGTLFNKPTGTLAGDNVYAGCVIDYQEKAVTPANFIAILTGNKSALTGGNGRVLESTA
jgi:legumain